MSPFFFSHIFSSFSSTDQSLFSSSSFTRASTSFFVFSSIFLACGISSGGSVTTAGVSFGASATVGAGVSPAGARGPAELRACCRVRRRLALRSPEKQQAPASDRGGLLHLGDELLLSEYVKTLSCREIESFHCHRSH